MFQNVLCGNDELLPAGQSDALSPTSESSSNLVQKGWCVCVSKVAKFWVKLLHFYICLQPSACNAGDLGSIPVLGRSPGEGNGNPLWYSCLGNPTDGGAWWARVHGVAKSWTWLSDFTFLSFPFYIFNPQKNMNRNKAVMNYIRLCWVFGPKELILDNLVAFKYNFFRWSKKSKVKFMPLIKIQFGHSLYRNTVMFPNILFVKE